MNCTINVKSDNSSITITDAQLYDLNHTDRIIEIKSKIKGNEKAYDLIKDRMFDGLELSITAECGMEYNLDVLPLSCEIRNKRMSKYYIFRLAVII